MDKLIADIESLLIEKRNYKCQLPTYIDVDEIDQSIDLNQLPSAIEYLEISGSTSDCLSEGLALKEKVIESVNSLLLFLKKQNDLIDKENVEFQAEITKKQHLITEQLDALGISKFMYVVRIPNEDNLLEIIKNLNVPTERLILDTFAFVKDMDEGEHIRRLIVSTIVKDPCSSYSKKCHLTSKRIRIESINPYDLSYALSIAKAVKLQHIID